MITLTLLINHLVQVAWNVFKGEPPKAANTKPPDTSIKPRPSQSVDPPDVPPQSISGQDSKSGTLLNSSRVEARESVVVAAQVSVTSRPPPLLLVDPTPTPTETLLYNQVVPTREDSHELSAASRDGSDETMASVNDVEEMLSEFSLQAHPGGRGAASSASEQPIQRAVAASTSAPPPPAPTTSVCTANNDPSITQEMRRTNKFTFLLHAPTVEHVRSSNVMFVMRGLPGSGKSTVVRLLKETYPEAVSCSADDHFLLPDGTYRFRQEGLSDAHEACQRKARAACERATPVVIIDNTNVRMWEMKHYVTMASQYGYTTVTVEPRTAWRKNARELAARNKHGVPEDIIYKKVQSYEEGIPLYYGWFLNRNHSNRVMEVADAYFGMTLRACPGFKTIMDQINDTQGEASMTSVYLREDSSSDCLHCTAFYANRGRTRTASAYHNMPHVTEAMGRAFTLEVVGYFFTNKTAGARIRINPKLMPLWGKDDNEGRHGGGAAGFRSDSQNWRSRGGRVTDNATSYSSAAGYSSAASSSLETSRFRPVVGEGSRAHLTLGYTKAGKAVQTGFDLQEVVAHEARATGKEGTEQVDGAVIRCYNNAFWVVYLDEPIPIQTLFSGRY